MTYSIISMLATAFLLVAARDVLWHCAARRLTRALASYRSFLFGTLAFYATDIAWGFLVEWRWSSALFIDTSIYFIAMAATVALWARYAAAYLAGKRSRFGAFLRATGSAFLACTGMAVAANCFRPVFFWFDAGGVFHAGPARTVMLACGSALFLLTAAYAACQAFQAKGPTRRRRLTLGLFSAIVAALIALQLFNPLIPCYALGLMLGGFLLHGFVDEDEKDEWRRRLERFLKRELMHKKELEESRMALQSALAAAESASRAKTAFLSNMSHEIRTPMNAVIGLNGIALNSIALVPDCPAAGKVKDCLKKTDAAVRHLLDVINDVLDMSRIESGSMAVRHEAFSLGRVLEEVEAIASGQCRDKGLDWSCRTKGRPAGRYKGDARKLKQVLINLLGNAVKYTPEGGRVRLVAEEGPRFGGRAVLKFAVSDTGIGMSPEYLPHIFDAFSQEDDAAANRYGSTGLGMPIARSLVELMGGRIEVESEKGWGTTFTVTLTLDEDAGPDSAAQPAGDRTEPAVLKDRRVLLAEDVAVNAENMTEQLAMRGVAAEVAANGRIAVDMFESRGSGYYDAILMDMRMPEMDGIEATRAIRAMDRSDAREVPIIALTASAFDEDVRRSLDAGLDAHVSKPVEPETLFGTLQALMKPRAR